MSKGKKRETRWSQPPKDQITPAFNPLDENSIVETLTRKLFDQDPVSLPPQPFNGRGVYALYYKGDDELYKLLRGKTGRFENGELVDHHPIYVGKSSSSEGLYERLTQHADSINDARNLKLEDFECRRLVVARLFIGLAEDLLIGANSPPWNKSGFGIHDPGAGRKGQARSAWDTLHPGRPHAEHRPIPEGAEEYWRQLFIARMEGKSAREIRAIPKPEGLKRSRVAAEAVEIADEDEGNTD